MPEYMVSIKIEKLDEGAYLATSDVLPGLVAEGITVIDDIYFIERGYEEFDQKLRGIGAQIEKVSDEKEIQKFILKVS